MNLFNPVSGFEFVINIYIYYEFLIKKHFQKLKKSFI